MIFIFWRKSSVTKYESSLQNFLELTHYKENRSLLFSTLSRIEKGHFDTSVCIVYGMPMTFNMQGTPEWFLSH